MPHLRFRGVPAALVQDLSQTLPAPLSELIGCPEDWFTFEHIPATFFFGGDVVQGPALVEFLWFDRGIDCQDQVAALLTEHVSPAAGEEEDTSVIFLPLNKQNYYENGERFG